MFVATFTTFHGNESEEIIDAETILGIFSTPKKAEKCISETSTSGWYSTLDTSYKDGRFEIQEWKMNDESFISATYYSIEEARSL